MTYLHGLGFLGGQVLIQGGRERERKSMPAEAICLFKTYPRKSCDTMSDTFYWLRQFSKTCPASRGNFIEI
jgi:hypothetical protein